MADQAGTDIQVGDQVMITDKNLKGEVVDVREFGGKHTFVVHTEKGSRVVVGRRQLEKVIEA